MWDLSLFFPSVKDPQTSIEYRVFVSSGQIFRHDVFHLSLFCCGYHNEYREKFTLQARYPMEKRCEDKTNIVQTSYFNILNL